MRLCLLLVACLFVALANLAGSAPLKAEVPPTADRYDQSLRKGETRATLDPAQFDDPEIRKAYQVAKEIPWVLDSIYCYCFCQESPAFRHKSLLSCYVDLHAAR